MIYFGKKIKGIKTDGLLWTNYAKSVTQLFLTNLCINLMSSWGSFEKENIQFKRGMIQFPSHHIHFYIIREYNNIHPEFKIL